MTTFQYFIKNPIRDLLVNDKPVQNWVGTKTDGGYYKNGYIASLLKGKNDKYSYIQLNIYTSVKCTVDIEEKWLIRSDDKIIRRLGWNNVDLLRICRKGECEEDIKIMMGKWSMWKEYA
tara:strand:+ start:457 stop:813 length:357 start_codon:yes stop_codon:yes gene_type:complete